MKPRARDRARTKAVSGPAQKLALTMEKAVYGGACLARAEGKAVFVPLTLPGEQVRARVVKDKGGFAEAEAEQIMSASPQRTAPPCPYFGTCGGCSYQHTDYATQRELKRSILRETLERAGLQMPVELAMLAGEPWGYRNRIRLAFDPAGNMGYRGRRSHAVVPIEACPIAAPVLMKAALAFRSALREPGHGLRCAELALFCDSAERAVLANVLLTSGTKGECERLAGKVADGLPELHGADFLIEQHSGSQRVFAWGQQALLYRAACFDYRVDTGAFFQVNRWLVDALVEEVTRGAHGGVAWDLYAGVGLFARRLAQSFEHGVAVESALAARAGLIANLSGTAGEAVHAETLAYLRKPRTARPDLIVVDPPRTGLGPEITSLLNATAAPRMVYVSCDPATLARDLRALSANYTMERITLADLFPQTFHLETVVHLRRT